MFYVHRFDRVTPRTGEPANGGTIAAPIAQSDAISPPAQSVDAQPPVAPRQGIISIYDISGGLLARLPAAVSGGGWVALPAKTCVGGFSWTFAPPGEAGGDIIGGVLGDDDEVGVWQLNRMDRFFGPPLVPADLDAPLQWISLVSSKTAEIKHPVVLSQHQNAARLVLPEAVDEPGVFMQNGTLAGWTFEDPARGYAWTGLDEDELVMEMTVTDFYRLSFEDSREEQFIRARAVSESQPVQQLNAFAAGFLKKPRLSAKDTPPQWTAEAAILQMRDLITRLVEEDWPRDVFAVLDAKVLAGTGDEAFIEDVLTLVSRTRGADPALLMLADVLADGRSLSSGQTDKLKSFQRELFLQWLNQLYAAGQFQAGWTAYGRAADIFTDDPDIGILGIRLALALGDWAMAERLVNARAYPEAFSGPLRDARTRIEELKAPRKAIAIRFAPGSSRVPADAVIDDRLPLSFVVDTGATMVTIPTQAAVRLGYDVNAAPMQTLMTAGGMVRAPKIILDSISVGGWVEYRVPAVVLDLPDKSDIGLLGLNFLNRFRMDLNSREGMLVLHPK